jgi:predicted ArsR family transcriptional regulator
MSMLRQQLLDTARGRIVTLLQKGPLTVDEIAAQMRLTTNAVRVQITGMERDGLVRRSGRRAGTTRPPNVYELTAEVEQLLSRAYIPLLTQVIRLFADSLLPDQVDAFFRESGKGLAEELLAGKAVSGDLASRVKFASDLMNSQLGATTHVEADGPYIIRGVGCPLAAITGKHPSVCHAMESLVGEIVGVPVHECCDRAERPKCCFEIRPEAAGSR